MTSHALSELETFDEEEIDDVEEGSASSAHGSHSGLRKEVPLTPSRRALIIGVAGGTASGKTTVCDKICAALDGRVTMVSHDNFYKELTSAEQDLARTGAYNFDHPDAFDHQLFRDVLWALRVGKSVEIPKYDFKTNSRVGHTSVLGSEVVIIEGIMALYDAEAREMMDMKIFVDTDSDTRLARRIRRDIQSRGRTLESVLTQYEKSVKPSYDEYINPTKKWADIIIPRGGDNFVAIDLITKHISFRLSATAASLEVAAAVAAGSSAAPPTVAAGSVSATDGSRS